MTKRLATDPAREIADRQMRAFADICGVLNPFRAAQYRTQEISAAIDWPSVGDFAAFHGVRPALHKALAAMPGSVAVASKLQKQLSEFQRGHRFRVMQTTAHIVALARGFEAAGVAALFFKGAMLGEQIYGGAQYREFNDVDILVAPAQRRRAEQVLEALDFAPVIADVGFRSAFFDYFRQHNFRHRDTGTTVDFHWGFVGTGPFPISVERALGSAVHVNLAGAAIPVPGSVAQALILAGHGHKENWASFGWVLDFATFAAAHPALPWDLVSQAARSQNCLEPLQEAILLMRDVFGVTVDQELLHRAEQRRAIISNVEAVRIKLAGLAERKLRDDLMSGFHLCETAPQRVSMALALLITPTIGDFEAWPLGPRWWWTYRVTRPARLALRALARRAPTRSKYLDPR